jgi:hypothetical protein
MLVLDGVEIVEVVGLIEIGQGEILMLFVLNVERQLLFRLSRHRESLFFVEIVLRVSRFLWF